MQPKSRTKNYPCLISSLPIQNSAGAPIWPRFHALCGQKLKKIMKNTQIRPGGWIELNVIPARLRKIVIFGVFWGGYRRVYRGVPRAKTSHLWAFWYGLTIMVESPRFRWRNLDLNFLAGRMDWIKCYPSSPRPNQPNRDFQCFFIFVTGYQFRSPPQFPCKSIPFLSVLAWLNCYFRFGLV